MGNIASINNGQAMNLSGIQPAESREPIPAGKYLALIADSDIVGNKSGTGNILKLVWEVQDGPYRGRKVWTNLNIQHQNQTAQEIAQRELKAICDAIGFYAELDDSAQLHGRPCVVSVKVTPARDGYDAKNEISGYALAAPQQAVLHQQTPAQQTPIYQTHAPQQAPVYQAPQQQAAPARPAAAPWQR